jgi:hypothetical protein
MKNFLAVLILFVPFLSFAQSNYQPGYMVNSKGDTIKGYIDYKERSLIPSDFKFKSAKDSEAKKYDLTNSLAFGINDLEAYQRFVVDISMSKESLGNLSYGLDTSSIRDTVFLKVLQDGKNVTLFAYNDQLKKRYYMLEKNKETPEELKRNIYHKPEGRLATVFDNRYIRQLYVIKKMLQPNAALDDRKWKQIKYVESDLIKVAADMNETELVKSQLSSTRFFIGAGLNRSSAKYIGDHDLAEDDADSKSSYLPFVNVGFDLFANPAIKKVIYRAELSLLGGNYKVTKNVTRASTIGTESFTVQHAFNQYTAQLSPQIIFNIYNTHKFKFFVSGGASLNFSIYNQNVQTTTYTAGSNSGRTVVKDDPIDLASLNFSPRLNTGVVLNNKLEIFAGYHGLSAITKYLSYNIGVQRIGLGVNLMMGK